MYLADPSSPIVVAKKSKKHRGLKKSEFDIDQFAAFEGYFKEEEDITMGNSPLSTKEDIGKVYKENLIEDQINSWLSNNGIITEGPETKKMHFFANKQIRVLRKIQNISSSTTESLALDGQLITTVVGKISGLNKRLNWDLEIKSPIILTFPQKSGLETRLSNPGIEIDHSTNRLNLEFRRTLTELKGI